MSSARSGEFESHFSANAGDTISTHLPDGVSSVSADSVDLKISRRYSGLYGIERDLTDALKALEQLKLIDRETIAAHALFSFALVSYVRCFNTGDGRGAKLHDSRPWIEPKSDEQKLHRETVALRDRLICHAGNTPYRAGATVAIISPLDSTRVHGLFCQDMKVTGIGPEEIDKLATHIGKLLTQVCSERAKVGLKLHQLVEQRLSRDHSQGLT